MPKLTKKKTPSHVGLRSLILTARELGALRVRVGDIEVELDPRVIQLPKPKSPTPAVPLKEEKEPTAEELLFHSAPDIFAPEKPE